MQQDVLRLCVEPTAADDVLARLGDPRIWNIYRGMVRRRLLSELKIAYRRTADAVGDAVFEAAFEHVMATDPPKARFFHRVPAAFEPSASAFLAAAVEREPSLPPHAVDLLRYEAARWAVSDLDDRVPDAASVGELNFDGVPVLNPALRLLSLAHAVHREPQADGGYEAGEFFVALHRAADDEPVRAWSLSPVVHSLLAFITMTPASLTVAIQAVTRTHGIALTETFLDGLCGTLAQFHERRLLLGSRAAEAPSDTDGASGAPGPGKP